ncbi:MAG: NAD(P)-dependent oxidoreductase [Anaerolineae bacterium]|nr:NAD(P)-dependent oxidoreductase [Anaerolineae bacterium]
MQYAADVARQFILAADEPQDGAFVFNLGGKPVHMQTVVELIQQHVPGAQITYNAEQSLPFAAAFDDAALHQRFSQVSGTPLETGIAETLERFRQLG